MEKISTYDPINIASGRSYTIKDILRIILEIENFTEAEVVFNTSKPSMIPKRLIDISKAKTKIGFEAKTSLKRGIEKTVKWYRKQLKSKMN